MKAFPDTGGPRVFPAIDLRGGRCVRLVQGKRTQEICYDADPVEAAVRWVGEGAECLHVIDLGAAFGEGDSRASVLAIAARGAVPVQTGGGIRDEETVAKLLEGGVARVILGTRAFQDPEFLSRMVERHGPRCVMVSLDVLGDRVRISGWERESGLGIEDGIPLVERAGVERLLVTATDRDGTLSGPRVDLIRRVLDGSRCRVVAAGGIGKLADVEAVLAVGHPRLDGVVIGRALYEGTVSLREALEAGRKMEEAPSERE
jgi:phosphoribosylformimino-5-aminoimidazole carboxamide ribotide isomerase